MWIKREEYERMKTYKDLYYEMSIKETEEDHLQIAYERRCKEVDRLVDANRDLQCELTTWKAKYADEVEKRLKLICRIKRGEVNAEISE